MSASRTLFGSSRGQGFIGDDDIEGGGFGRPGSSLSDDESKRRRPFTFARLLRRHQAPRLSMKDLLVVIVGVASLFGLVALVGGLLWSKGSGSKDLMHTLQAHVERLSLAEVPGVSKLQQRSVREVAPITLVVSCLSRHWQFLPLLLESIANQTMLPQETVIVLSQREAHLEGLPFLTLSGGGSVQSQNGWANSGDLMSALTEARKERRQELLEQRKEVEGKRRKKKQKGEPTDDEDDEAANIKRMIGRLEEREVEAAGLESLLQDAIPLETTMRVTPNVRLHVRGGNWSPGSNRVYGAAFASTSSELISFFDCNDYMQPQRTEVLYRVFQKNPSLDAAIHSYALVPYRQPAASLQRFKLLEHSKNLRDFNFLFPAEHYHASLPHKQKRWNPADPDTEINWPGRPQWWFPTDMTTPSKVALKHPQYAKKIEGRRIPPRLWNAHNAWLTVRREVLEQVPYPTTLTQGGEDSLYNWRIIRARKNFNYIHWVLGAQFTTSTDVLAVTDSEGHFVQYNETIEEVVREAARL